MEAVNIRIGPLEFDHADYDADGDVLYLHVGQPQPGEGEETPEGHVVRFAPGTQRIVEHQARALQTVHRRSPGLSRQRPALDCGFSGRSGTVVGMVPRIQGNRRAPRMSVHDVRRTDIAEKLAGG